MRTRRFGAALAAVVASAALAPSEAPAQTCDFAPITAIVDGVLAANPQIPGAALRLAKGEQVLYERYFGTYSASTVVPIASASKLLSAASVMTLVDAGVLDLDAPVSAALPAFSGAKGGMTLRQMFSHTSGLPGGLDYPVLADKTITLAQAVDQIACCIPLAAAPGSQFAYGGLSMQVAGRIAEVADGQLWDVLFAQRLAGPLGLTHTDYDGFGPTDNPRIAGGARSSLDDYGRLLEMLIGKGFMLTANYQPLLDEMAQIQTLAHAEIAACAPTPAVAATSPAGRLALALALVTASAAAWRHSRSASA